MKYMSDEQREQFDYRLSSPLPGRETTQPADALREIEGNAFMAAMMQHQTVTGQRG